MFDFVTISFILTNILKAGPPHGMLRAPGCNKQRGGKFLDERGSRKVQKQANSICVAHRQGITQLCAGILSQSVPHLPRCIRNGLGKGKWKPSFNTQIA